MILKNIAYVEHLDTTKYWELKEFEINDINLIVGNNASGKTRTLNVIAGLGRLLLNPKTAFVDGKWSANFVNEKKQELKYVVHLEKNNVLSEDLVIDNEILIAREKSGVVKMKGNQLNEDIVFKISKNELAVFRKDDIQFPYLTQLHNWASNLRHFRFAKEVEKMTLGIIGTDQPKKEERELRETDRAIAIFKKGMKQFGNKYKNNIIADLNAIDYSVKDIALGPLQSIRIDSPVPSRVAGLLVQELDRKGKTDQVAMSDGMFRALSMLIHFNYYELTKLAGLVLIDDIGEGLDFHRSTKLIKLLIEKSQRNGMQLIMSTNDKFVMNSTDLDYWQIIQRVGGKVSVHNKSNSANVFGEFKFTGLNNFDFYATDFINTGMH